jgi:hypothetical protein
MQPDSNLWYDKNDSVWYSHPVVRKKDAREFMERQHYAGLAVRGWLETKYFLLGSDFTFSSDNHCLSYMAKMGGWSILDYGINFAETPYDWLQLGYASYLSSWALMNTGTEESDYGYWYPGRKNDGAMGWAFMESKHGRAWIRKDVDRGAWYYDGEADLGNGAGIRMASTVVTDDPLFGWIAYGGKLSQGGKSLRVNPRDGLRDRFSLVTSDTRLSIELDRDGFMKDNEITIDKSLNKISFTIENRSADNHQTTLKLTSNKAVVVKMDGKTLKPQVDKAGNKIITLPVTAERHLVEIGLTLEDDGYLYTNRTIAEKGYGKLHEWAAKRYGGHQNQSPCSDQEP